MIIHFVSPCCADIPKQDLVFIYFSSFVWDVKEPSHSLFYQWALRDPFF